MLWVAVPGHHVFNNLQTLHAGFWFQLVPIPGRRKLSHCYSVRHSPQPEIRAWISRYRYGMGRENARKAK